MNWKRRVSSQQTDYVNINQVPNVRVLPLGTDNFGRDVLTELVSATGTSLKIGLVAGLIATAIGLTLGLMAGYMGGWVDDVIMFVTNMFTVIPSFVIIDLDYLQYRPGTPRRHDGRRDDWPYGLGVDRQGCARAGGFSAQSRSCQYGQTVRALNHPHHPPQHSCPSSLLMSSWPSSSKFPRASWPRPACRFLGLGPRTTEVPTLGFDDELGDDLLGASARKMVGLLPRDLSHRADYLFLELDEYGARPGI